MEDKLKFLGCDISSTIITSGNKTAKGSLLIRCLAQRIACPRPKALCCRIEDILILTGIDIEEKAKSFVDTLFNSLGYFEAGPYESDIQIPHTRMEKIIS